MDDRALGAAEVPVRRLTRQQALKLVAARPKKRAPKALKYVEPYVLVSDDTVTVQLAMETRSEANQRGNWRARDARRKLQKQVTAETLAFGKVPKGPYTHCTMIRLAPGLLDTDNLHSAFKSTRDAIATYLGVNDGPSGPITWICQQRPLNAYGAMIVLWREP